MIDVDRVFRDIFNDRDALQKLIITALLAFSVILFPIGLISVAVLLGYQMDMIRNVRDGLLSPMPRWEFIDRKLNTGVTLLIAGLIYNLPNFLWSCLWATSFSGDSAIFSALACCCLPLLLLTNLTLLPLQVMGTVRFADTNKIEAFFRFSELFDLARANFGLLVQWWIFATLANVLIGAVGTVIPCIGWLAVSALLTPIQAHLMGQLAAQVSPLRKRYT